MSNNLAKRKVSNASHSGLLAQYVSQKMAKQVVSEFYNERSQRGSEFGAVDYSGSFSAVQH